MPRTDRLDKGVSGASPLTAPGENSGGVFASTLEVSCPCIRKVSADLIHPMSQSAKVSRHTI